jgi:hypothetical protein
VEFPEGVTLKSIFHILEGEERRTEFGEIVFLRHALDFSVKQTQPGSKKDEVLEENMIDVRRILKNSTFNRNNAGGDGTSKEGGCTTNKRAGLINLQGVE